MTIIKILIICSIMLLSINSGFGQIKVACIGDSITEGSGREHPDSYPSQLQELLGDGYEVKNFGVSGRTLLKEGDFPYWDEPQLEEAKAFNADIILIKLGTNDSKPQNWEHKADFEKDYVSLINEMKKSMSKNGKIYILIPVPVTEDNYGIRESVLVDEMRPILNRVKQTTNVLMIDLYEPLRGRSDLLPDGIHPNKEGLGVMAKTIATILSK
jgi:lysophospholipase L1-like esterase